MRPAVLAEKQEKLRKSGKAPKKTAWLPTWASLGIQSGRFHFNSEWQGPVPGMDKVLKECYELEASLQVCANLGIVPSTWCI